MKAMHLLTKLSITTITTIIIIIIIIVIVITMQDQLSMCQINHAASNVQHQLFIQSLLEIYEANDNSVAH